jgi:hypothetical protein
MKTDRRSFVPSSELEDGSTEGGPALLGLYCGGYRSQASTGLRCFISCWQVCTCDTLKDHGIPPHPPLGSLTLLRMICGKGENACLVPLGQAF